MIVSGLYDVCVIGAGPGGYVAAIRSAQLGLKTVIIEKASLGGVCLNVGCIPSKAMITASHFFHRIHSDAQKMGISTGKVDVNFKQLNAWKESVCDKMSVGVKQLLRANKVDVINGVADFQSPNEIGIKRDHKNIEMISSKYFILATGSRPIEIPNFVIDEKNILSSTGVLALKEKPQSIVIIGGGYIGLEIGGYLAKFGSQVTILEAADELLSGVVEKEMVGPIFKNLKDLGVKIVTGVQAQSWKKKGSKLEVTGQVKGLSESYIAEKVLVTVGRKPNSDQMSLKKLGVSIDQKGFVKTDLQRRSSVSNIFAIGDIAGQPMLAHKASYEGVMVAEIISGKTRAYDAKTVPLVIFTDPEVSAVGWTEEECKQKGYKNLKIGQFPFSANGRAVSMMEIEGLVKVIANGENNVVLGVHIVGPDASHLISEAALAIEMGATLEDLALTIHPHPTLSETIMESAEMALGHAIHTIQKPLRKA